MVFPLEKCVLFANLQQDKYGFLPGSHGKWIYKHISNIDHIYSTDKNNVEKHLSKNRIFKESNDNPHFFQISLLSCC